MKLTARDRILAMLIPSIIVVAAYGLFFLRGKVAECSSAEKALAAAARQEAQSGPTPTKIAATRQILAKHSQELQALQMKLDTAQKKWRYETAFCGISSQRNERGEKLTNLLKKNNLHIMEDAEVDAGKDGKLSASLEKLALKIGQSADGQKPHIRRIRFLGRYGDVHHVLEQLTHGDVLAIPVGLTLKTTEDPNFREWQLLVWI